MDDRLKKELQHLDGVEVDWDIIMAEHTSLRVGGPVFCLLRPLDLVGLQTALQVLNQHHYPYFILGRGTNLLVQDAGMRAVAISLEEGFSQVAYIDGRVKAGAGLRLSRLLRFCLQQSLRGLEFIAGIPGSVGGALRMNAGTQAGEMAEVCDAVSLVLSDGALVRLERAKLPFAYRRLELPLAAVVVEAEFLLTPGSREQIRRRIRSLLQVRKEKQPWRLPSAGSVFKNPPGDFAGRLIEAVGLKGVRIGDAQISPKHANFIVNRGQARARDILALIHLAREKVAREFGVHLELEIEVVGNNHNLQ
ncbi:MAG: UDP-N-acetylmuramate dehydrogenase [Deltaproteobacteria bacterium]|jgi:UDP-N-acetylmuramate dehydrogenase